MVSFEKNVCIVLDSVETVVVELLFSKVVCYMDISFKQTVQGEEKQKMEHKPEVLCGTQFQKN